MLILKSNINIKYIYIYILARSCNSSNVSKGIYVNPTEIIVPNNKNDTLALCCAYIRALALKNSNATLFYNSKKPLYYYTIPFYNTSTLKLLLPSFTH